MAKRVRKSTKETSEELNAVEEALKIDFGQEASADVAESLSTSQSQRQAAVTPSSPAANDELGGGSARLAAALNRRPSPTHLWSALIASVVWIAIAFWAGYSVLGDTLLSGSAWMSLSANPGLVYFIASIILPLLFIWGYAIMLRRSQELKLAAHSMTEAAYRLIEPERESVNSVRHVGQAIREEVGALTDGIERAMARASELEGLVHNEVSALESSYSDNELRMRSLVEELSNEREAIVNHTERVRSSISGASETLQEDLNLSAQQISENVALAQQQFAQALGDTNEDMKLSLTQASSTLLEQISMKGDEIGQQIENVGGTIVDQIEATRERTGGVFDDMRALLTVAGDSFNNVLLDKSMELGSQIDAAGSELIEKLTATSNSTTNAVEDITASLTFASESLNDTLSTRGTEIADRIEASAGALVESITTTGTSSSIRAIGPCLSSPAA